MNFFDIQNTAFEILNYKISYIEFVGTLFGFISVYLATRANVWTWSAGVINIVCLFVLFYQVQLYPDMFLQIYYLGITIIGWLNWDKTHKALPISNFKQAKSYFILLSVIAVLVAIFGELFANIDVYFPKVFPQKSAFPYLDTFVMIASIIATYLLAQKNSFNWVMWIVIDIVCVYLYVQKGVYFLSIEYGVFVILAIYGYINWSNQLKTQVK